MRTISGPDIFGYLSYRLFLADWFDARKAADKRFSHRLFARRAGVRSPSLLKEVIAGQRSLTPATLEGFVRALGLNHAEAGFFADLVDLDQARTLDEKNTAWERVAASRRFRSARPIEGALVRYLSNWYYPAIRELALLSEFRAEAEWVASQLTPRISIAQAREALGTLFDLGMLVEDGQGVRVAEVSLATPHQVAGLVAHNYHRQMLERATDSLTAARSRERHLCGLTVAIPMELVPRLKAELDAVQERLLHLCDQHAERAERVYQLELLLVPLSRAPETP